MLSDHVAAIKQLNLEADRLLKLSLQRDTSITQIDQILTLFGNETLDNKYVCSALAIEPQLFLHPKELLDAIIAAYQQAGLSRIDIHQRLLNSHQPSTADGQPYREAISQALNSLEATE